MKPLRIYLDTSVFGGCFDDEFRKESLKLLDSVRNGHLKALISEIVVTELETAPAEVKKALTSIPTGRVEIIEFDKEAKALRDAYLKAGILTKNAAADAGHVACATIARADAIVSWNFKHIVQLEKMRLYNQVDLQNGYGLLNIVSPKEVVGGE